MVIQIAYDYDPNPVQQSLINPLSNFSPNYGSSLPYGVGTPYGGDSVLEQWRIFLAQQRCQSFQLQISESYNSTLGVPAGAGFTLSGLNIVVGLKKGFRPIKADHSVG
jgi:long-subunit fatty acid transport protein